MSEMTNPMEALKGLQSAFESGLNLQQCSLDSSLSMLSDKPNGIQRFSYAKIDKRIIKALSLFVAVEPIEGLACFNVGYAVPKIYRNQGLGSEIVNKGIAELTNGLHRSAGINKFHIEAIIDAENIASQKVALKTISTNQKEVVDSYSGKKAYLYTRLVESN